MSKQCFPAGIPEVNHYTIVLSNLIGISEINHYGSNSQWNSSDKLFHLSNQHIGIPEIKYYTIETF